ncbi:MAG: hypothetical protein U0165_15850 [Polyangiaceae bacterium]
MRFLYSSLAVVVLGISAAGCWVESDPPNQVVVVQEDPQPDPDPVVPKHVDIETGATMQSDPGSVFGVYVEYHGDGKWVIWSTCDTANSGISCHYHFTVTPLNGSAITESTVTIGDKSSAGQWAAQGVPVSASYEISYEIGSYTVQVNASGLPIQLEATLDGDADPKMIYWVSNEVVRTGAPTNPVIFEPSAP